MSITIISKQRAEEDDLKERRGFFDYREFEYLETEAERYIKENLGIIM